MNYPRRSAHSSEDRAWFCNVISFMVPVMSESNVDDRQESFRSTADGDIVYVKREDDRATPPPVDSATWQARSPPGDEKNDDGEEPRNPASPRATGHQRNLSSHFFESTTIGKKHRRLFSNEPPIAHRRMNSIGSSKPIPRHQRENSEGLDALSSVAAAASQWEQQPQDPPHRRPTYPAFMPPPPPHYGYPGYPPAPPHYYPPPAHYRYPVQYSQRPPAEYKAFQERKTPPPQDMSTQGSQTFVTAIATGEEGVTRHPKGHHRKLSSFGSIGTILAGTPDDKKKHHRVTSSSVSFLQDLDVGITEAADAAFLRNLQASNESPIPSSDTKLAAGGTSKRARRKCTVPGCANRVVQGGLCISHGAKRKTCKHPGCTKNVKKAGLCSAHGPARKRCETDGCQKVAVQGGRCIAHGAKKKMCARADCEKQAILDGLCKKHHDEKPSHTRGLSIFQDLSADDVGNLLNEPRW